MSGCTSLPPRYELVYTPLARSLGPSSGSLVLLPPSPPLSTELLLRRGGISVLSPLSLSPFPVGEKEALRIPLRRRRLPLIQLAPRLRGPLQTPPRLVPTRERGGSLVATEPLQERRALAASRPGGLSGGIAVVGGGRVPSVRTMLSSAAAALSRDPLARGMWLCWGNGRNGRKSLVHLFYGKFTKSSKR